MFSLQDVGIEEFQVPSFQGVEIEGFHCTQIEVSSFQVVGIEEFHCIEVSSFQGVVIDCIQRCPPFQGVGIEEFHCPHFRGLDRVG